MGHRILRRGAWRWGKTSIDLLNSWHGRVPCTAFCLRPRTLLSATARKPLARDGRDPGLRCAVSRLERAHYGGVLCNQWRGADCRSREPDSAHPQQLRAYELQPGADAAVLAGGEGPADLCDGAGGGQAEPAGVWRARLGDGAGLQPHHHAAGLDARPGDADRLGHGGLRAPLWAQAGGDVAGRDGGRPGVAGPAGAARHSLYDSGAAPVRAGAFAARAERQDPRCTRGCGGSAEVAGHQVAGNPGREGRLHAPLSGPD